MTDDDNNRQFVVNPTNEPPAGSKDGDGIFALEAALESPKNDRFREIQAYKRLIADRPTLLAVSVLPDLLRTLTVTENIGDDHAMLASLALSTALSINYHDDLHTFYERIFSLEGNSFSEFGETFVVHDLECFKLVIIYGYVKLKSAVSYPLKTIRLSLAIIFRNCIKYTRYSYVAFRILHKWLEKSVEMNFWSDEDTSKMEGDLEKIIFANWDSSLSEIAKKNSTEIFSIYLNLMRKKNENYLSDTFAKCVQTLSWQNVTTYTILVEICKISDDSTMIVGSWLPECIFTSLTRKYLEHAGTLLYSTIMQKLTVDQWKNAFGDAFFHVCARWETEKNYTPINLVWDQWMKPTIAKFQIDVIQYLWEHPSLNELEVSQKCLENLTFPKYYQSIRHLPAVENRRKCFSHDAEIMKLRHFSTHCRTPIHGELFDENGGFSTIKVFLYYNADACTSSSRKEIMKNFLIFLTNVSKIAKKDAKLKTELEQFYKWLESFFLDCFEIGSINQRKFFGLLLLDITLNWIQNEAKLLDHPAGKLKIMEIVDEYFRFPELINPLIKLAIDQAADVREKSISIILRYFPSDAVDESKKTTMLQIANELSDIPELSKIAGASAILRILSGWTISLDVSFWLEKLRGNLKAMRKDILKAVAEGQLFFSGLTNIVEVYLSNEWSKQAIEKNSIYQILHLIEEAATFFLLALSSKDEETKFSASFEKMSIAVKDSIRNSELSDVEDDCVFLSPAYQLVLTCIWMSLKACCETAAAIGIHAENEEDVSRAVNVVVSVLLKCRHKGAIEVAGVAIANLTKKLSRGPYEHVIERHLFNLLSIGSDETLNLTRRGVGLTIMFHRIVSSDQRPNRPFLHSTVQRLLDTLAVETSTRKKDCYDDLPQARCLHFLRSLVADKGLHPQLIQHMEKICLMCFKHLQSSDWTIRNASLQLYGAIVPRIVGQYGTRDLTYGIGNSVNYFVTHYPELAENVLEKLESFVISSDWEKTVRSADLSMTSEVVPILTLLSKMSLTGCALIDHDLLEHEYDRSNYATRARKTFFKLLGHPVFQVRLLAAKAYAAFVPLSKILRHVALMKLKRIDSKRSNFNHGQLLAQIYLQEKYDHEISSTSDHISLLDHKSNQELFEIAIILQFQAAKKIWDEATYGSRKIPSDRSVRVHYIPFLSLNSLLFRCLFESSIAWRVIKKVQGSGIVDHEFFDFLEGKSRIDRRQMLDQSVFVPEIDSLYPNFSENSEIANGKRQNISQLDMDHLGVIVKEAMKIVEDPMKTHLIFDYASKINDFFTQHENQHSWYELAEKKSSIPENIYENLRTIVEKICRIGENSTESWANNLQQIGIALRVKIFGQSGLTRVATVCDIAQCIQRTDGVVEDHWIIECFDEIVKTVTSPNFFKENEELPNSKKIEETHELFMKIVVKLLMDEVPETRESTAKMLQPLVRLSTHFSENFSSLIASGPRPTLHRIICGEKSRIPMLLWSNTRKTDSKLGVSMAKALTVYEDIAASIDPTFLEIGFKSPHDQDETFHRDDANLLNLLFCSVKRVLATELPNELNLMRDVMDTRFLHSDTKALKFDEYLRLSTAQYLSRKKSQVKDEISVTKQCNKWL